MRELVEDCKKQQIFVCHFAHSHSNFTYIIAFQIIMSSNDISHQLKIRFDRKPRKCKKLNDTGIGTSQRIVCISDDTFYYYPKIQEFNDLDFHKLRYSVPKAGIKLKDISDLKFPQKSQNERHYFSITLPKRKILKYNKSQKQNIVDKDAEGEQLWRFLFDYDIISLPQIQQRNESKQEIEMRRNAEKRMKEEQEAFERQQQRKIALKQEYETLIETEKALLAQQNKSQYQMKQIEKQKKEEREKKIKESDELYFMEVYERGYGKFGSLEEELNFELDLLEVVGKFKHRAEVVARNYVDGLPYDLKPIFNEFFKIDNLFLKVGDSKEYNQEFLDNRIISQTIFNERRKIKENFRVPLYCLIKYKGFKVLVRTHTPVDDFYGKTLEEKTLHGFHGEIWKTHFLISDELTSILDQINLKPYISDAAFQKNTLHLGNKLRIIETLNDPFQQVKALDPVLFANTSKNKITYLLDLKEVFPIDLDLENNINQTYIRLRPQFVMGFKNQKGELTSLSGGGLMSEYQDQQGSKNDLILAQASQKLKYQTLHSFVKDLDELKYILEDSKSLSAIMKAKGINIRYIGSIYKLTSLPYIREMTVVEGISREIKKIYRDHQKQFVSEHFRLKYQDAINKAYGEKQMKKLRDLRIRELKKLENQQSIANAIDYLNLIFGNTYETEAFWDIVLNKLRDSYKIEYKNYLDLPHGYLLKTVLYHCDFDIKLSSSLVLFSTPDPFSIKDWIQFISKSSYFTFPEMEVYKKTKIIQGLSQQNIIAKLELALMLKRILYQNEAPALAHLALHVPNVQISNSKYEIDTLRYHIQTPAKQKFHMVFDICNFIMPPNHPYFQDLYLQYATIKDLDPILLKKAAQIHVLRSLGITHWKTSKILSQFKEHAYLNHLIAAEAGIEFQKKIQLYRKIVDEQENIGQLYDSFMYTKKAIVFVETRQSKLIASEIKQYYRLLEKGMEVTYKMRKIEDMAKISSYYWKALQKHSHDDDCYHEIEFLLNYIFRAFLEYSKKKYYLFKLALVFEDRFKQQKKEPKEQYLQELRDCCRSAKNHIDFVKEMLTKLEFGFVSINFEPDFFSHFWQHVRKLASEEFDEGLYEISLLLRVFGIGFFEEALLNRTYTFDKVSEWVFPEIEDNKPKKQKNRHKFEKPHVIN